jgi:hypothetical protein
MSTPERSSDLQFEKQRAFARLSLTNGSQWEGCFFVAGISAWHDGPERIGDLLHADEGFLPFEVATDTGRRTLLLNPAHILMVALADDEARRDASYMVARRQPVVLLLSSGERIAGVVRVHRPEGQNRLSDWSRQPERFRHVEVGEGALLLNSAHIVEVSEAVEP